MIVLEGGHVATVDAEATEYPDGHVVIDGTAIVSVGAGPAPAHLRDGAQLLDTTGCLVTPGLVNTHHHLYQWLTRGFGPDSTLFQWLSELYPIWARIDADAVHAAASANLGWLALSGGSTSTDHPYIFPPAGGLPPDSVVEDREAILIATEAAIDRWHDPSPAAMTRIAVAPCSPFSVTAELMREAAER